MAVDPNIALMPIGVYHTGATIRDDPQPNMEMCLGGKRSGTRVAGLGPQRDEALYGIRFLHAQPTNGIGRGIIRTRGQNLFAWLPPGETEYGDEVEVEFGERRILPWVNEGETETKHVEIERVADAVLSATESIWLTNTLANAVAGRPFISEDASGYTYHGLIVRNDSAHTVTLLKITHPDTSWISLGYEAVDGNEAIQEIADDTTAPTAVDFATEWAAAGITLAAGESAGLWVRKNWDNTPSGYKDIDILVRFTCDGKDYENADLCGCGARGKLSLAEYRLFVTTDGSVPDVTGAPDHTAASVALLSNLYTTTLDTTHLWCIVYRDEFGLDSLVDEVERTDVGGTYVVVPDPPTGPASVQLIQAEGGVVRVTAVYHAMGDDADQRADQWLVYLTTTGVDPVVGVDAPTVIDMADGDGYGQMAGLLLEHDTDALGNGVDLRVLVRTRRSSDTIDSENTTVYQHTIAVYEQVLGIVHAGIGGILNTQPRMTTAPAYEVWIDEGNGVKWVVESGTLQLWADTTLCFVLTRTEFRTNFSLKTHDEAPFAGVATDTVETGTWDVTNKQIWFAIGATRVMLIDAELRTIHIETWDAKGDCAPLSIANVEVVESASLLHFLVWDVNTSQNVTTITVDPSSLLMADVAFKWKSSEAACLL